MSSLPPHLVERRRQSRERARRRRRRRRQLSGGAAALVAIVVAIVALSASGGSHGHAGHGSARDLSVPGSARQQTATKVPVTRTHASASVLRITASLSPAGLALGQVPLTLTTSSSERVQISFHHPPSAGLLFNLDSGRVLWARDPQIELHIASLTKMMTALLVVKSSPPDERVLVTRQAVNASGSKVGVLPLGKRVQLETMLYGLLLPSGNDAAVALAQHVAGSTSAFVTAMNAEAAHMGLACTHYSSPSGYYDQSNFSCAIDLAELAKADIEQPRLARIVATYQAAMPFPIKGGKLYLDNNNPLLIYGYPGVTGMKTGFTESAGRCLVATAERDGVRLGVILLHSPNPGTQARQLLDRAFAQVYHQRPVSEPPMPEDA